MLNLRNLSRLRPQPLSRFFGVTPTPFNNESKEPIPPKPLKGSQITQALEDAASFDETTGVDQVQWRSSAYHRDEETYYKTPPMKPSYRPANKVVSTSADHSQNSSILFPGQGAQFVGMGKDLLEHVPTAKDLYECAGNILGYDLLKICLEGPQETLNQTKYCQPAIMVTSLAAVEGLFSNSPQLIKNCISTAGFSVGEITALVFSGAISFEDGIKLIKVRAEAMEIASEMADSGMMTVFYGADNKLGLAMAAARKWVEEKHGIEKPVCQIANYLYEGAKAIAGHTECLKFIEDNKSDFRIRKISWLPVSGAFHTPIMLPAVELFAEALTKIRVADPRIPVYSNVDQIVYTDVNQIRKTLPKQMISCVKWEQSMINMFNYSNEEFIPQIFECGPGRSLSAILQRVNGKVGKRAMSVKV